MADKELLAALKHHVSLLSEKERKTPIGILGLSGSTYTLEQIITEIENDTEVGRFIIKTIHFNEIRRFLKGK